MHQEFGYDSGMFGVKNFRFKSISKIEEALGKPINCNRIIKS